MLVTCLAYVVSAMWNRIHKKNGMEGAVKQNTMVCNSER